ncbi:hypothetical protein N9V02_06830 [Prochlorococcus sp. AH-736-L23]|nr:hypothetical protein [Prochlorococcus sp. AH-736-L23]
MVLLVKIIVINITGGNNWGNNWDDDFGIIGGAPSTPSTPSTPLTPRTPSIYDDCYYY